MTRNILTDSSSLLTMVDGIQRLGFILLPIHPSASGIGNVGENVVSARGPVTHE